MATNLQRKLTLAGLVGKIDIKELIKAPGERMDLAIIRGVARRYKPDQTAVGDFVRFYGQFRGTNMTTGEVQDAPQMIAPKTIEEMLYGAIGPDGDKDVAFAFKIGVRFDDSAITKYVYEFESLMQLSENDPISRMDRDLQGVLAALPKPAQAQLPAPPVTDPTKVAPPSSETVADLEAARLAKEKADAEEAERQEANARAQQRAGTRRR